MASWLGQTVSERPICHIKRFGISFACPTCRATTRVGFVPTCATFAARPLSTVERVRVSRILDVILMTILFRFVGFRILPLGSLDGLRPPINESLEALRPFSKPSQWGYWPRLSPAILRLAPRLDPTQMSSDDPAGLPFSLESGFCELFKGKVVEPFIRSRGNCLLRFGFCTHTLVTRTYFSIHFH
jgi:hypothetical protein